MSEWTDCLVLSIEDKTHLRKAGSFEPNQLMYETSQFLFTQESLKINSFKETCKAVASSVPNPNEFKEEMKLKCKYELNHLIFVDNIKKIIGLSRTDDDLLLLTQALKKFIAQTNVVRFGSFKFGPEVMRLHYVLDKPKEALNLLEDPDLTPLFNQISSYIILGDLLLIKEMYEEAIRLVNVFLSNQFYGKKYPANIIIIYYAACYKLNTPESLNKACQMWEKFSEAEYKCPMRAIWFFSLLALNQKQPDLALEIITPPKPTPVGNNIKLLALADKKEHDEVIKLINLLFFQDAPKLQNSNFITADTLKNLEKVFENSPEEYSTKFKSIKDLLLSHNLVKNEALDTFLMGEIEYALHVKKLNTFKMKN